MSHNPYAAPTVEEPAVGVLSGQREDLRKVAAYQHGILYCILAMFVVYALMFVMPKSLQIIPALMFLCVSLTSTVFIFLLATKVYGIVIGVLLGIITLVPCLGLLVLLMINGRATTILRSNGIPVGLLGAKSGSI